MEIPKLPDASRKRKGSVDDGGNERPIKHRASQACQSCRTRKVRCDVLANGSQCTNCRLDSMECIVLASRRGKTSRARRNSNAEVTEVHPAQSWKAASMHEGIKVRNDSVVPQSSGTDQVPACVTFDEDTENVDADPQPGSRNIGANGSIHASPVSYVGLLTPETRTDMLPQQQSALERVQLPVFIAPLSSRILPEDLDFLIRKGALTVPEPDLCIEILRAYMFSVHPFMPMLDYRTFVHAILHGQDDSRISLLLFQAVMFAGLHSLQSAAIQRLGFDSTKQARDTFFNRARLLYEFDIEPDSAAVFQALVLMSSWYSKRDGRRDTWHWVGLAYDVARRMGLHREPTTRYGSEKVRHQRRRLWWSVYIRDRMIALGTRRPMRIQDNEFDVAMLSLEDFDLAPFEESYQGQQLLPPDHENRATASMCIQLAKLCLRIGHVVSSQYTTLRTQSDQDIPHTVMVVSRRDEGRAEELEICDRELSDWFRALPAAMRRTGSDTPQHGVHNCSEVHWAMLNLTYQTTINVLHRAHALKPVTDAEYAQAVQASSRSKVKESARSLTRISQTLLRRDELRFLGLIGVTAIIGAYLSHMLDIGSADEDVRDATSFRLHQSLEVLQAFRNIYASADAAVSFLASVSRNAGISIPAQVVAQEANRASALISNTTVSITNGEQAPTWKDGNTLRAYSLDTQDTAQTPGWHADSNHGVVPVLDRRMTYPLLNDEIQASTASNNMPPPTSSLSLAPLSNVRTPIQGTSTPAKNGALEQQSNLSFVDAFMGSFSNPNADGGYFDWNGDTEIGLDLEPMSFNYDFYSDGLGFLDGLA